MTDPAAADLPAPSPEATSIPEPSPSDSPYTSDGGEDDRAPVSRTAAPTDPATAGAVARPSGTATAAATAANGGGVGKAGTRGRGSRARGVGNGKPPVQGAPPVLLLLGGVPGSGKSTFCRSLLEAAPVAWVHVNQDAISNGRPGSREQCLAALRFALDGGACCLVDRCHLDAEQRSSFLELASERGVAAHCVALQPPLDLCARRVAGRTDHPGGVQGDTNKKVVYQMAKRQQQGQSWPPTQAEGFASVMDCRSDADADAAVRAWAQYGSSGGAAAATAAAATAANLSQVQKLPSTAAGEPAATGGAAATAAATVGGGAGASAAVAAAGAAAAAAPTLALWQVHVAKRKPAAAGGIMSFLAPRNGQAGSGTKPVAGAAGQLVTRTATPAAAGTCCMAPVLGAAGGQAAAVASGGSGSGGVGGKAAGLKRSGPEADVGGCSLAARGAKRAAPAATVIGGGGGGSGSGSPGGAAASRQAGRPVEAPGQEAEAGSGPGSQGGGDTGGSAGGSGGGGGVGAHPAGRNAFLVLMASASKKVSSTRGDRTSEGAVATGGGGGSSSRGHPGKSAAGEESDPRFRLTAAWAQPLRNVALNPDKTEQKVLYKDDQVVMIADAFPKARHHALVLARDPQLRSIANLRKEHLPLLQHMNKVAEDWVRKLRQEDPTTASFKLGFHAVPSMAQLHMHVVSQDFDSPCLKNKKHWNTFTTRFFMTADAVRREIEERGRLTLMSAEEEKQLEGQDMKCHGCAKPLRNIPDLKKHIVSCNFVQQLPGL